MMRYTRGSPFVDVGRPSMAPGRAMMPSGVPSGVPGAMPGERCDAAFGGVPGER